MSQTCTDINGLHLESSIHVYICSRPAHTSAQHIRQLLHPLSTPTPRFSLLSNCITKEVGGGVHKYTVYTKSLDQSHFMSERATPDSGSTLKVIHIWLRRSYFAEQVSILYNYDN